MTSLVSICPRSFSMLGPFLVTAKADSDTRSNQRRVTKTKTLDGGVVIDDRGFSDGDRSIIVQPTLVTKEQADLIELIAGLNGKVTISINGGVFEGVIDAYNAGASARIRVSVILKVSE